MIKIPQKGCFIIYLFLKDYISEELAQKKSIKKAALVWH